jgi:chorismate mutase
MFKKKNGVTVFQSNRYNEILEKRARQAELSEMSGEFMKKIFEAIHEESVRQQMEILNN